jgi:hypothetical protein
VAWAVGSRHRWSQLTWVRPVVQCSRGAAHTRCDRATHYELTRRAPRMSDTSHKAHRQSAFTPAPIVWLYVRDCVRASARCP